MHDTANPLPLLVEVGVLRVVPGGTVPSHVIGLTAALTMLAALAVLVVPRRVRRAQCPLVVPEVVLELDLLPLVDQLLTDQQELIDGCVTLVVRVVRQSSLELRVESSVGPGVLRRVVPCNELGSLESGRSPSP